MNKNSFIYALYAHINSVSSKILFIIGLCFLTGCATYQAIDKAVLEGKNENTETFILLRSGQKITGKSLVFPKDPGTRAAHTEKTKNCWYSWDSWMGIDDKKFQREDICAFQAEGVYYAYAFTGCVKARRLRFGRINLYYYERDMDHVINTYFVFDKSNDKCNLKIIIKDLKEFYDAIADNPAAAKLCKDSFPGLKRTQKDASLKKLLAVVEKYNE